MKYPSLLAVLWIGSLVFAMDNPSFETPAKGSSFPQLMLDASDIDEPEPDGIAFVQSVIIANTAFDEDDIDEPEPPAVALDADDVEDTSDTPPIALDDDDVGETDPPSVALDDDDLDADPGPDFFAFDADDIDEDEEP